MSKQWTCFTRCAWSTLFKDVGSRPLSSTVSGVLNRHSVDTAKLLALRRQAPLPVFFFSHLPLSITSSCLTSNNALFALQRKVHRLQHTCCNTHHSPYLCGEKYPPSLCIGLLTIPLPGLEVCVKVRMWADRQARLRWKWKREGNVQGRTFFLLFCSVFALKPPTPFAKPSVLYIKL